MKKGKSNKADLYVVIISKLEIKSQDTERIVSMFKEMTKKPKQFMNRVELCVEGYDSDERELCTIPEVRSFMKKLKSQYNSFFFLINFISQSLSFVMFSSCQYKTNNGEIFIEEDELIRFLLEQFGELNLLEHIGVISSQDNRRISDLAGSYFAR